MKVLKLTCWPTLFRTQKVFLPEIPEVVTISVRALISPDTRLNLTCLAVLYGHTFAKSKQNTISSLYMTTELIISLVSSGELEIFISLLKCQIYLNSFY